MSGAQALVSMPVPQQPVASARDAGALAQDPAAAEAAAAAFEDALGGVETGASKPDKSDDKSQDRGDASVGDETASSQSSPPPQPLVGGGLAAALAAIGMPWAVSAQQSGASDAVSGTQTTSDAADPLELLTRALAANDREPASAPVASTGVAARDPGAGGDFIDVHIFGRERHLAVDESAKTSAQAAAALEQADAVADRTALASLASSAPVMAAEAAAATPKSQVTGAPSDGDASLPSTSLGAGGEAASDDVGAGAADPGKPVRVGSAQQREQSSLNSAGGEVRDLAGERGGVEGDTDVTEDTNFAGVMQKAAGATPQAATSKADGVAASPASQIVDQLAAPQAREVISVVKTTGDTKVIELELKPENLGSVTVRVSLKDDVISLKLEAQRADTAQAIGREVDKLASSLKQAGYVVDGITAQQMDPRTLSRIEAATGSNSSGSSTQGQAQSSGQGQSFQGNGAGAQQGSNGRGNSSPFEVRQGSGNNDVQNNGLAPERQTGLYV